MRRIRFRLETSWRVEAAELIDALPIFDDVPVDVLNELAGRVRLRVLRRRTSPCSARATARRRFYVVRHGVLEVVEEDPDTGEERQIRTLARGESFGELGLVTDAPRAATVRAIEDAELFEIDEGAFDRLLADMIRRARVRADPATAGGARAASRASRTWGPISSWSSSSGVSG